MTKKIAEVTSAIVGILSNVADINTL